MESSASASGPNTDYLNEADPRSDQENAIHTLTDSTLKALPFKTTRHRSDTTETEIDSEINSMTTTNIATNMNSALALVPADHRHSMPPTWDAFVRQGTRLKSLLGDAMVNVRNHHNQQASNATKQAGKRALASNDYDENDENAEQRPNRRPRLEGRDSMAELLHEKTTENLRLQRVRPLSSP
jgi:hypothetical protein